MSRRRAGSAVLTALALAALVLGVVVVALLTQRKALTERWLVGALAARGIEPASVRVARLDTGGLTLADVAIGAADAPDLTAAQIDIGWSLAGLRAGYADTLHVSGLRLRAALGAAGWSLGALDPLLAGDGEAAGAATVPALPAREITLDDARVALATPDGPASGAASGALRSDADGALDGNFALALEHPLGRATAALTLAGLPDALRFEATLADDAGRLSASAHGAADLAAGSGQLDWRLEPLAFAPGALQPATLVPALAAAELRAVSGRVEAHGSATLAADGTVAYRADVALRAFSFVTPLARVEHAHGTVALRGPPLHTPAAQLLSIALLDLGVPLVDGLVEWQLRRDGTIALARTRWGFAGGELSADDLVVDPRRALAGAVTLRARDIDLDALFAQTQLEGLSGSGRVTGEVPLALRDGAVVVTGGRLYAAEAGGTIRYAPAPSVAAMAASRPGDLGLAVAAFSDFRFDELEARLDGDLTGERRQPGLPGRPARRAEPESRSPARRPRARGAGVLSCAGGRAGAPARILGGRETMSDASSDGGRDGRRSRAERARRRFGAIGRKPGAIDRKSGGLGWQRGAIGRKPGAPTAAAHVAPLLAAVWLAAASLVISACQPRVVVEAPKDPIVINMNIKIEHEIRVKVDKDLDQLFANEKDLF